VVEKVSPEPNSYVIRLLDGRIFRRTRSAINLDQSTSAGFGTLLPAVGPNPHDALPAAPQHGSRSLLGPLTMSLAATAVRTSAVTPGRSFAAAFNGKPVSSPAPAHQAATSHSIVPRLLEPCLTAPTGPISDQPSGSTRSGKTYIKQ
jgi:hypothetical protein